MDLLAARLALARLQADGVPDTPEAVARLRASWAALPDVDRAQREADLALAARHDTIAALVMMLALLERMERHPLARAMAWAWRR